jgi:hypothetical protein
VGGLRSICFGLLGSVLIATIPAQFGGTASAGTSTSGASRATGKQQRDRDQHQCYRVSGLGYPRARAIEWISDTAPVVATRSWRPPAAARRGRESHRYHVTGTPTAIFYQTFTVTALDTGDLDVWADDTAGVWLDSGTVPAVPAAAARWSGRPTGTLGGNCANAPIGCLSGMDAVIPLSGGRNLHFGD